MQDVARDGRVLLSTVNSRLGILYAPPNGAPQRDLAWLDSSLMYELSNDGKSLVFVELSNGQGRNSAIYLRKTDGSAAIQLGYGNRPSLSPDGKWVACIRHVGDRSSLMLLPTGPGESRFPRSMESISMAWSGSRITRGFCLRATKRAARCARGCMTWKTRNQHLSPPKARVEQGFRPTDNGSSPWIPTSCCFLP